MKQKIHLIKILLITLLVGGSSVFAEKIVITAGVPITWDRLTKYQEATEYKTCDQISNYVLPGASRGLSEMLLICQAIKLGGVEPVFDFMKINSYARLLKEVKKGKILLMMESAWLSDADQSKVFVSDPILDVGEFEVGLYTLPTNTKLLKVRTLKELQKFTAITNKNWVVDWATLEQMNIKKEDTSLYPLMFKKIKAGRGDFMLEAFSNLPDMSQTVEGIKLIPIPNIKIGLKGSRHILINKKQPNAKKVFNALQIGLKQLRKNGTITKAYRQSGFLHSKVKDWELLCCKDETIK